MTPLVRLADERQGDQRDRQVLEDQGEHRRSEIGEDLRLRRGRVLELGLGRGGDDLGRDRRGAGIGGRDVALGLLDRLADDRLVDGVRQVRGEEPGVVRAERVDGVDLHADDRLLAGPELRFRVGRGDDHHVGAAVGEPGLGGRRVIRDRLDVQPATCEILVGLDVRRQA